MLLVHRELSKVYYIFQFLVYWSSDNFDAEICMMHVFVIESTDNLSKDVLFHGFMVAEQNNL